MELVVLREDSEWLEKVENIYYQSFPQKERIDFKEIKEKIFSDRKLYGFFHKGELIGFSYVIISTSIVYLFYFAIEKSVRNIGFGSEALKLIQKEYRDKNVAFIVEKPDSENEIKDRRINFYKRNGFELTNLEFDWFGETYCPMCQNGCDREKLKEFLLNTFSVNSELREIK